MALNIHWSGWQLLKESTGGLMDEAVPPGTLSRIRELISGRMRAAPLRHMTCEPDVPDDELLSICILWYRKG